MASSGRWEGLLAFGRSASLRLRSAFEALGWNSASKTHANFASKITAGTALKALEHHSHLWSSPGEAEITFLDVAAGSGDFTKALAAKLQAAGKKYSISCTDFAEGMVKLAEQSVSDPNVKFFVMDGQDMSAIEDKTVDGLTCLFGIMFMKEYEKCLTEMKRVLKPGAKATVSTWLKPGLIHMADAYGVFLGALEEGEVSVGAKLCQVGNTLQSLEGYLKGAGFSEVKGATESVLLTPEDLTPVYQMIVNNPILSKSIKTGKADAKEPSMESFQEFISSPLGKPFQKGDGKPGCVVELINNIAVGVA